MNRKLLSELLKILTDKLLPVCGNSLLAEQESWWILQYVLGKARFELLLDKSVDFSSDQEDRLNSCINQRIIQRKPIAYILGHVPFCDVEILVNPPVLIPRHETEEWACWFASLLKNCNIKYFSMLDLCCGSGCIGLALAKTFPDAKITGIDISEEAIKLSNINKIHNKLSNIKFLQSDIFATCLDPEFNYDFIVANPPYLTTDEYDKLDYDVKLWEDKSALVADNLGMQFYEKILLDAPKRLNPRLSNIPQIVLEIGPSQNLIEKLMEKLNYKDFEIYKDMQGKRRWVAIYIRK